jgi:alginate O-acetyltransferase complex protein AlgI
MVFSTPVFLLCFLPIVIGIYYVCCFLPLKIKIGNAILLAASLVFYAWGEPFAILLMLFSILVSYVFGLAMMSKHKRLFLLFAVAIHLGILVVFKYSAFIISAANGFMGKEILPIPAISLPIGISFFTFQAMSYLIDVYRGETKVNRNILDIALYISFFPQLIAGPIVRYHDISEQIRNRKHSGDQFSSGVSRFVIGLSKKVLIANIMANVCDSIFALPLDELPMMLAIIGAVAYTMQIFFDFSGYSDMAIGLARIFGFDLRENFKYPYFADSIRDFWKRWHISLSTWFRDYLYFPLGGNRKGKARMFANQWIVMLLCGFWHGASWTFIFWGAYHAVFLTIERTRFGAVLAKAWKPLRHIYTMVVVVVGWVFFRADSLQQAVRYIYAMAGGNGVVSQLYPILQFVTAEAIFVFAIGVAIAHPIAPWANEKVDKIKMPGLNMAVFCVKYCLIFLLLVLSAAAVSNGTYNPFIYFRF